MEVVQGLYIAVMWQRPAATIGEEKTWLITHHIFGLIRELGLDRQLRRTVSSDSSQQQAADDHGGSIPWLDDTSVACEEQRQRLIRNGERTYLRASIWQMALNSLYGRESSNDDIHSTAGMERWWQHPLATQLDRYTAALIFLRGHLVSGARPDRIFTLLFDAKYHP